MSAPESRIHKIRDSSFLPYPQQYQLARCYLAMLPSIRKTYFFGLLVLTACSQNGPAGLFKKVSPHDQYASNLRNAGLSETALGREWFSAAARSLENPLSVSIPYRETGYFPSNQAKATALRFQAVKGTKISIDFSKKPVEGFTVYIDLWRDHEGEDKRLLAYADTGGRPFHYEAEDDNAFYILRLQPELLTAGEYTLTITSGPSLAFPVPGGKMQSFWGAARDGGARQHEGIDIFAPRRTPAVAAADGVIRRVGTNNLGGKVVFLHPDKKNFSIYYAHLDTQLVSEGQMVRVGDTLGLVGNTGNARGGAPHLHLGLYGNSGAIDPYPYVNPTIKKAEPVRASVSGLGKTYRTASSVKLLNGPSSSATTIASLGSHTFLRILSASSSWYKVALPDGREGYLPARSVTALDKAVERLTLKTDSRLLDRPDEETGAMKTIQSGELVPVYAKFNGYMFVRQGELEGWIKTTKATDL